MKSENLSHVILGSAAAAGASLALITGAGAIVTSFMGLPFDVSTIAFYAGFAFEVVLGLLLYSVFAGGISWWLIGLSALGKRYQLARGLAFFIPAVVIAAVYVTWFVTGFISEGPSTDEFTNSLFALFGVFIFALLIYNLRDHAATKRDAKSEATMERIVTAAVAAALAQLAAERARSQDQELHTD